MFTETFNEPPQVQIQGPDSLYRMETGNFMAVAKDDDGQLSYEWALAATCPANLAATNQRLPGIGGAGAMHSISWNEGGTPCLFVVVTDGKGARSLATHPLTIKRRELVLTAPAVQTMNVGALIFSAAFKGDPTATEAASFSWQRAHDCAEAERLARAGKPERGKDTFNSTAGWTAFCVAVVAWDQFGAEEVGTTMVPAVDISLRPPIIRVHAPATLARPAPLYTELELAGLEPQDMGAEGLAFEWWLTPPGQPRAPAPTCPDIAPAGSRVCFATDRAGDYKVELAVTFGGRTVAAEPLVVTAVDFPPCIRETEPSFSSAPKSFAFYDQERVFRVLEVSDDADPLPATTRPSQGTFSWSVRKGDAPPGSGTRVDATLRELTVPAREYQPGDRIEVRVRYLDRLDRTPGAGRNFDACPETAARCELAPGCYQWVTWTVEYL